MLLMCSANCDKLKDDTLTLSADTDHSKDSYQRGESVRYQCVAPGAQRGGVATCRQGAWQKSVECGGKWDG